MSQNIAFFEILGIRDWFLEENAYWERGKRMWVGGPGMNSIVSSF